MMMKTSCSPFAHKNPNLLIKKGAPALTRPTKEVIAQAPSEAKRILDTTCEKQTQWCHSFPNKTKELQTHLGNKHFLIAGGTGSGLGCAMACAIFPLIKKSGTLTILSRDLPSSVEFETSKILSELAKQQGMENRFFHFNTGLATEGKKFETLLTTLKNNHVKSLIYVNTIAAAHSGLLPDQPPIYVKDINEEGLFQWELTPLTTEQTQRTRNIMGELSISFPSFLEQEGIQCELSVFADWRGSLDVASRIPQTMEYGRQGAYSGSLWLPKAIIQNHVWNSFQNKTTSCLDIFFPVMETRALKFIPGGTIMAKLIKELARRSGTTLPEVPELAMKAWIACSQFLSGKTSNPFPRLDLEELLVEKWFHCVHENLNNNPSDSFYYKKWLPEFYL